MNSNYLRTNLSLKDGTNGEQKIKIDGHGGPFDMISDEDLLGSNFDKISKIFPNQDNLIENICDESISPIRRGTAQSKDEKMSKIQLLVNEINQLKQVIMIKDNTI